MPSARAPAALPVDDLHRLLAAFTRDGYVVLSGFHPAERLAAWRDGYHAMCRRNAASGGHTWLGSVVEMDPPLMLPAVAEPRLLDLAEAILGPRVLLDNLTFMAFPSVEPAQRGTVSGWHRDIWAQCPAEGVYQTPLAINAICYLQDLDDAVGPLRVIPGSHRRELFLSEAERQRPHPEEVLVRARAGDVVVTHAALWHTGSANTSGALRYFLSAYFAVNWLSPRDNHNGPLVQGLIAQARGRGDHRLMRLFGVDDQRIARAHGSAMEPDEVRWRRWAE